MRLDQGFDDVADRRQAHFCRQRPPCPIRASLQVAPSRLTMQAVDELSVGVNVAPASGKTRPIKPAACLRSAPAISSSAISGRYCTPRNALPSKRISAACTAVTQLPARAGPPPATLDLVGVDRRSIMRGRSPGKEQVTTSRFRRCIATGTSGLQASRVLTHGFSGGHGGNLNTRARAEGGVPAANTARMNSTMRRVSGVFLSRCSGNPVRKTPS